VQEDADLEPELIACVTAPLPDAKEILSAAEAAEISAVLARADCCGRSGCACPPKIQVCVAEKDLPRMSKLLQERWWQLLEREGTYEGVGGTKEVAEGEHLPCPACGTAAPLLAGACSDCGLHLE
jgi:hypothetical protein